MVKESEHSKPTLDYHQKRFRFISWNFEVPDHNLRAKSIKFTLIANVSNFIDFSYAMSFSITWCISCENISWNVKALWAPESFCSKVNALLWANSSYSHVLTCLCECGKLTGQSRASVKKKLLCIELDLNRGGNPFGPIRRQDTKIGGCHLPFFPGWNDSLVPLYGVTASSRFWCETKVAPIEFCVICPSSFICFLNIIQKLMYI